MRELTIPHNFEINEGLFREGLQAIHPNPQRENQGVMFTRGEQLSVAELMMQARYDIIELGAPVNSPFALETARELIDLANGSVNTAIAFHGRCARVDLDAMLLASQHAHNRIFNLYIGTSPENRQGNGGRSLETTIGKAIASAQYLREQQPDALIRFSTEDAFRTPFDDLMTVISAVSPYVDRIGLPDTTGRAYPEEVEEVVGAVKELVGDKELEFHEHTDLGMGAAGYVAALRKGVNVFSTSTLGLGERTGPASTTGFLSAIYTPSTQAALERRYDLTRVSEVDQRVAGILGIPVPHTNPISARGAFTHGAGVHYNAHRANHGAYAAVEPAAFGREHGFIVASGVVGGAAIMDFAQMYGMELSLETSRAIADHVREQAKRNGEISEPDVLSIIEEYSMLENQRMAAV